MVVSVFSPCPQCGWLLPGVHCGPQHRVRCSRFLDYIQALHRVGSHHILIKELKMLVSR